MVVVAVSRTLTWFNDRVALISGIDILLLFAYNERRLFGVLMGVTELLLLSLLF